VVPTLGPYHVDVAIPAIAQTVQRYDWRLVRYCAPGVPALDEGGQPRADVAQAIGEMRSLRRWIAEHRMFHQCGQTMISAYTLRETIECGDFEANGFARNREEARKLGQAMVEQGFVHDRNWHDPL
jgi:hypothetical protein